MKRIKVTFSLNTETLLETYGPIPTAVTVGAGVQWHEAYDFVNQQGRMMVGGLSLGGSVGAAGGWLQGGGHSLLSPTYGLGMAVAAVILVCSYRHWFRGRQCNRNHSGHLDRRMLHGQQLSEL